MHFLRALTPFLDVLPGHFQGPGKVGFEDLAGALDTVPGDRRDLRLGGAGLAHQDDGGAPQVAGRQLFEPAGLQERLDIRPLPSRLAGLGGWRAEPRRRVDLYLRAGAAQDRNTKEDYQLARKYLARAIALDPGLAQAHHNLSLVHFMEWMAY